MWMPLPPSEPPSGIILNEWLLKGQKKLTIDDETNFVEPNILRGVLESKVNISSLLNFDKKCNGNHILHINYHIVLYG